MEAPVDAAQGNAGPPGRCWCCGSIGDPRLLVHLGNHPEVAMCLPCARWAAKEAWAIEDRSKSGPLVTLRNGFRKLRRRVVNRNWHRHPVFGRPLRWLGKRLP